jgi:CRISPR type III-B/RAMP module RAMP protein Cmr1
MQRISTWFSIQEELKQRNNWFLTISCKNSSYLRIGGYNARPYSLELEVNEGIRSSKLKGYLRWWVRILKLGQYGNFSNYKDADAEIEKYIGSEKKEHGQSKFVINVKYKISEEAIKFRKEIFEMIDKYTSALLKFKEDYEKQDLFVKNKIEMSIDFHPGNPRIRFESNNNFRKLKNDLVDYIKKELIFDVKVKDSNYYFNNKYKRYYFNVNLELKDKYKILKDLSEIPRIKLILMERKEEKNNPKAYIERIKEELSLYPPYTVDVSLSLFSNKPFDIIQIGRDVLINLLVGLILMLIFTGLSAFSLRGFAGVKIIALNVNDKLKNILGDIYDDCIEIIEAKSSEELEKIVEKLLKKLNLQTLENMPEVPTLDSSLKYFKFKVFEVRQNYEQNKEETLKLLNIINQSVMKSTWKKIDNKDIRSAGSNYHTWILGLPRSQKNTGYIVHVNKERKEDFRRKSAIGINIFENKSMKFIVLHGFLSNDWPVYRLDSHQNNLLLVHYSHYSVKNNVIDIMNKYSNEEAVQEAFKQAFDYITNYITNKLNEIAKN